MSMYIEKDNLKNAYAKKLKEKGLDYPEFKEVEKREHIEKVTSEYFTKKQQINDRTEQKTIENLRAIHKMELQRIGALSDEELEKENKKKQREIKQTLKGFEKKHKVNTDLQKDYENWNGFTPETEIHAKKQKNKNRRSRQKQNKIAGNNQRLIDSVEQRVLNGYNLIDNKSIECVDLLEAKRKMNKLQGSK